MEPAALVVGIVGAATALGATSHYEPHDPILIVGDEGLLLPDSLSGNGVRGGLGTEADPWRISGWRIEVPRDRPALFLAHVRGHVLIEDMEIVGPVGGTAFWFDGADHVRIERLVIDGGPGIAMRAEGSGVSVRSWAMDWSGDECVVFFDSRVRVQNAHLVSRCVRTMMGAGGSLHVQDVDVITASTAIAYNGPAVIANARLRAAPKELDGEELYGTSAAGLIDVSARSPGVVLRNVSLHGLPHGPCVAVRGERGALVRLEDVDLIGCGDLEITGAPGATARGTDLRVEGARSGIRVRGGTLTAEGVVLVGNGKALSTDADPVVSTQVHMRDVAFARNQRNAEAKQGVIVLEDAWWESGDFYGNVQVRDRALDRPTGMPDAFEVYPNDVYLEGTLDELPGPALFAIAGAAAAVARLIRRR